MKSIFRKTALLLMLLALALSLTACYRDVDPWPASAPPVTELPPTAIATAEPTPTPYSSTLIPRTTVTPEPAATAIPQTVPAQEAEDFWDSEPTEVPGGSADPGVNG